MDMFMLKYFVFVFRLNIIVNSKNKLKNRQNGYTKCNRLCDKRTKHFSSIS